jgi:NADPH:quinone reductase-like Zn-dependent oxidoreductase
MKSWWIKTVDGAMALELRDIPIPQPGPGQVSIRIRAAALNRGEFIAGHGLHTASVARPAGFEASGEVTAVGQGVTRWKVGDRVMGRCDGAFAEHGLVTADEVFAMPERLTWEQAAASTVVYLTVYEALMAHGRLAPGEWMLVAGITSGVGVAALQVGKALGAHVIGTSGSLEKLERLKDLGLDLALHTRAADFVPAVMKATQNKGVDVVVNNVGGSVFDACVEAMGFQGRLAMVGYVDGQVQAPMDLNALHSKRLQLFGVSNKMRTTAHRVAAAQALERDLLPMLADGRVTPWVDQVFAFDDLPAAQLCMQANRHLGKLVVRVD